MSPDSFVAVFREVEAAMMAPSHFGYATPLAEDHGDLSSYTRKCRHQRKPPASSLGRLGQVACDTSLRKHNSTLRRGWRAW
jgi:hypothetical protein